MQESIYGPHFTSCLYAAFCLVSLCVRLALSFIHSYLKHSFTLKPRLTSLGPRGAWNQSVKQVCPGGCGCSSTWEKLCVCVSVFVFTFNSDLISQSQNVLQWDRKLCWNSEFITWDTDQRQSLEKNQTNLCIYESRIHFTAYIAPALRTLIPTCHMSS